MPQGGEPAEPPQGQDEPGAGQVPRQHQEAPKLMNDRVPGKGISAESVVCGLHSIQTLPPIDQFVLSVFLSRQSPPASRVQITVPGANPVCLSLYAQQSVDVLTTNITYISLIYTIVQFHYIHTHRAYFCVVS